MALLAFQKPDKVIMLESDDSRGKFEFRPLEPGFGVTIGNSLRRILLSSLEGFAITSIKIDGVNHEFSSFDGVVEDITEIILNLKKVRLKRQIEGINSEKVNFTVFGLEVLTAGEFNKYLSSFQVINTDLVICNLNPNVKLNIELNIDKGRGYVLAEDNKSHVSEVIGTIALDAIYTPIKNVNYWVEDYRVEQKTDYEKLVLEILTDGSIHPKNALNEAAKILIQHFMLFSDEKITLDSDEKQKVEELDETDLQIKQLLKTKLIDMDLSVRALNCLKAAEVDTLGELVSFSKNDLLKFRNFGKKSLSELEELVRSKNFYLGMDISKYNLDKD